MPLTCARYLGSDDTSRMICLAVPAWGFVVFVASQALGKPALELLAQVRHAPLGRPGLPCPHGMGPQPRALCMRAGAGDSVRCRRCLDQHPAAIRRVAAFWYVLQCGGQAMQLFANVTCLFLTAPPPLVQALCCSWQGRRSAKPSQAVHFDWVPTTVRGGVVMVAAAAVHATAAARRSYRPSRSRTRFLDCRIGT